MKDFREFIKQEPQAIILKLSSYFLFLVIVFSNIFNSGTFLNFRNIGAVSSCITQSEKDIYVSNRESKLQEKISVSARILEIENNLSSTTVYISSLNSKIDINKKEMDSFYKQYQQYLTSANSYKSSADSYLSTANSYKSSASSYLSTANSYKSYRDNLKKPTNPSQNVTYRQYYNNYNSYYNTYYGYYQTYSGYYNTYYGYYQTYSGYYNTYKGYYESYASKYNSSKSAYDKLSKELSDINISINPFTTEINTLKNKLSSLGSDIDKLSSEINKSICAVNSSTQNITIRQEEKDGYCGVVRENNGKENPDYGDPDCAAIIQNGLCASGDDSCVENQFKYQCMSDNDCLSGSCLNGECVSSGNGSNSSSSNDEGNSNITCCVCLFDSNLTKSIDSKYSCSFKKVCSDVLKEHPECDIKKEIDDEAVADSNLEEQLINSCGPNKNNVGSVKVFQAEHSCVENVSLCPLDVFTTIEAFINSAGYYPELVSVSNLGCETFGDLDEAKKRAKEIQQYLIKNNFSAKVTISGNQNVANIDSLPINGHCSTTASFEVCTDYIKMSVLDCPNEGTICMIKDYNGVKKDPFQCKNKSGKQVTMSCVDNSNPKDGAGTYQY